MHIRQLRGLLECLNAGYYEIRVNVSQLLSSFQHRADVAFFLSLFEGPMLMTSMCYDGLLKAGRSELYYESIAHALQYAIATQRKHYQTILMRQLDQNIYNRDSGQELYILNSTAIHECQRGIRGNKS